MGEEKTLESPLNKIRKMSQKDDIPVPSCSYSKKSNVINSNLQNNNLPLKSGNDSENKNVAKTVKAKPTIITMHHWHKLLAGKKESKQTKTDGLKKKEPKRSSNLFVDRIEGKLYLLRVLKLETRDIIIRILFSLKFYLKDNCLAWVLVDNNIT